MPSIRQPGFESRSRIPTPSAASSSAVIGKFRTVERVVSLAGPLDSGQAWLTAPSMTPIDRFYASGVAIAVGTDSLASVADLNLFSELKMMRRLAPQVPARKILESATLVGAKALGLESDLGSITPGKRAQLICVQLPDAVDDVEEYLVSGIEPAWIQPLNS